MFKIEYLEVVVRSIPLRVHFGRLCLVLGSGPILGLLVFLPQYDRPLSHAPAALPLALLCLPHHHRGSYGSK